MELKPVENWSLCMHGQCIDIISDLYDAFIGDGGKYKFTYEVKRIDGKCEMEAYQFKEDKIEEQNSFEI